MHKKVEETGTHFSCARIERSSLVQGCTRTCVNWHQDLTQKRA